MNKIRELIGFLAASNRLLIGERKLFVAFLILSFAAALTEGIGVAMLAPVLESQSGQSAFATVPILNRVTVFFDGVDTETKLQRIALILGCVVVLRGMLLFLVEFLSATIPIKIQRGLHERSYNALLGADHLYFSERTTGEHANSLNDWPVRVAVVLTSAGRALFNFILFIVYLILMLSLSWRLALVAGAFAVLMSLVLRAFTSNILRRAGAALSVQSAIVGEMIYETISGMKFIRASAAEGIMSDRYRRNLAAKVRTNINMEKCRAVVQPFLATAAGVFICTLLFFGPYFAEPGSEWIGSLLLFLFLLLRLVSPISQISGARAMISSHIAAFTELNAFFEATAARRQKSGTRVFDRVSKDIVLNDVSFRYPSDDKPALKDFSVHIPAEKMVAIVGPSGAGKTTLINLLLRFFDPQKGTVTIDGTDLREYDIHHLRRNVSIVSQDIFIFNDTVRENLRFATEGKTEADLRRATDLAAASEFIDTLPEGYDTKLGDRGVRLSGGQQQRIAVARAFLRDPSLLIFDEATSHLDSITEQAIQNAIQSLRKGRTLLVIAHRLSTIRNADLVIVMKEGAVVEQGTHSELLQARGEYWNLVNHQQLGLIDENPNSGATSKSVGAPTNPAESMS